MKQCNELNRVSGEEATEEVAAQPVGEVSLWGWPWC